MLKSKISSFEIVLLFVGIATAYLGFRLINHAFLVEQDIGWVAVTAIFSWLILIVLFVSLSLTVDIAKKQLRATNEIHNFLTQPKGKKK